MPGFLTFGILVKKKDKSHFLHPARSEGMYCFQCVCASVCVSVRLSVRPSVCPSHLPSYVCLSGQNDLLPAIFQVPNQSRRMSLHPRMHKNYFLTQSIKQLLGGAQFYSKLVLRLKSIFLAQIFFEMSLSGPRMSF